MKKISAKQYALALYESAKDKDGAELKLIFNNFLKLLRKNKDWKLLNKVVLAFAKIVKEKEGKAEAEVIFSQKPAESTIQEIKKWLDHYTNKDVKLISSVNQDILGGAIIKLEDKVIDLSVKSSLKKLQLNLNK